MSYYKIVHNGYIVSVGKQEAPTKYDINEEEYNTILAVIKNVPKAEEGYGYRLREDLTWELYELPQEQSE